jgi:hypothetical protein
MVGRPGWSATWVNVWDVALTSATSCAAANAGSAAVAAATDPTTAPTLLTPASKLATRVPSSPADALIATRAPARARTRPRIAGATRTFATFAVNVIADILCLSRVRAQPPRRELWRGDEGG